MTEKTPHLELKPVEDPDRTDQFKLGLKRVEDPDPADQLELVLTDGNGNSVTYRAPRGELKKDLIKLFHQLERY